MSVREWLFAAVSAGDADAVTGLLLREAVALASEDIAYAMATAAREGHVEIMAAFLEHGYFADLALGGTTPLMEAREKRASCRRRSAAAV